MIVEGVLKHKKRRGIAKMTGRHYNLPKTMYSTKKKKENGGRISA